MQTQTILRGQTNRHGDLIMGRKRITDIATERWPDFLKNASNPHLLHTNRPLIIDMDRHGSTTKLVALVKMLDDLVEVIDEYDEQFAELQLSINPQLYKANEEVQRASIRSLLNEHYGDIEHWKKGSWVYFGWRRQLVHILSKTDFYALRTIRNRDLITSDEQDILRNFNVACAGLSVGSAGALALGITGISEKIKLSDGAIIKGSNLNRIQTGIMDIGQSKSSVIARKLYEMNPFMEIHEIENLDSSTITEFFNDKWPAMLVVDEIDDLEMKVLLRIEARNRRVPVVMATELGDSVMIDIERFDLEPSRPLFHNLIQNIERDVVDKKLSQRQWMKYATTIIDPMNMPVRMHQSLQKIGSSIVTHPQLGSSVMTTGGVLAFVVKCIALGQEMPSQRTLIPIEKIFIPSHNKRSHIRLHKKQAQTIIDTMNEIVD
jgi:molybdopterin/thiamine biosynthesis adenylyltransferase